MVPTLTLRISGDRTLPPNNWDPQSAQNSLVNTFPLSTLC